MKNIKKLLFDNLAKTILNIFSDEKAKNTDHVGV